MTERLFGTTGVRKVYGKEFDVEMALKLGKSLGTFLPEKSTVVLAQDSRTTGRMIADALSAGLLSTGCNVIRAGLIPTPTLAFITMHREYDTGVMVTASHNPPEYTGVKFWSRDSMGYTPKEEQQIEAIYHSEKFRVAEWDVLGQESHLKTAVKEHIEEILAHCDNDGIMNRQFKVIVDPGNGAASVLTPYLMRKLGCQVISINSQPDGYFPGRASEPDASSLNDLVNLVKTTKADLGIAHDGDSDRVVFVSETGEVVRGDRIIALFAKHLLDKSDKKTVVTTVDSSLVVDETVEKHGGKTIRTPVGDIQVAMKIQETNALFGGEACGVFIFPEFHLAPEPFLASCRVLELMVKTGKPFGELLSEIPVYPLEKTKVKCPNDKKEEVMQKLSEMLPSAMEKVVDVVTVDGLGLVLDDGWILVRPSGTEPVIRITCEASSNQRVEELIVKSKKFVESAI